MWCSTSWVEPTAYAVPTYYTTAYWMDPVVLAQPTYATTAYVRRGLFGRTRIVERPVLATYATAYVPTAYYAPARSYRATAMTVVDSMVVPTTYVATSDCVCPPALASAAPTYASPSRSSGGTSSGSRAVRSEAENRESMESNVGPAPEQLEPARRRGTGAAAPAAPPSNLPEAPERVPDYSPPAPPAAAPPRISTPGGQGGNTTGGAAPANPQGGNTGTTNPNPAGAGTGGNPSTVAPPAAPGGPADNTDPNNPPAISPQGTNRRESMKPSNYAPRLVPTEFRNVLMGKVVSRTAGEPEEGVEIRVRNAGTGADRSISTDAIGRFAIRLSDGDWSVDVTMPSGRVYEVSRLRVSDGQIVDNLGRRIPTLEITR